jgi:hypothetical protein
VLLLASCTGSFDDGPFSWARDEASCGTTLGSAPLRRLSVIEHANTLRDLFPGLSPSLPTAPLDDVGERSYDNDALALGPSDVRVSYWDETAFTMASAAIADPTTRARWISCGATPDDAEAVTCAHDFIARFGARALRHPLTEGEQAMYESYFATRRADIDFDAAALLTMTAMLESPHFLYRLELQGADLGDGSVALTPHELASRLSYLLWRSMPDDALFAHADDGSLLAPATLESEARRLLDDPRAADTIVDFHRQWLALDRVAIVDEPRLPGLYPEWDEAMRDAIVRESEDLVRLSIVEGDGTLASLFVSPTARVDASLAALYGVAPPEPGTTAVVTLPPERAGILTRAAFLSSRAHSEQGSPPLRGAFVMTRVLCEPSLAPPPGADTTPPMPMAGETLTNRMLFERRTSSATCRTCHERIDGFGFGFEHFDAIGRYRGDDHGLPIDATGALTGTDVDGAYDGAVELSAQLGASRTVRSCATRQWTRFAIGRPSEHGDTCLEGRIARAFEASGGDVRELLVAIATAPELLRRPRAEAE